MSENKNDLVNTIESCVNANTTCPWGDKCIFLHKNDDRKCCPSCKKRMVSNNYKMCDPCILSYNYFIKAKGDEQEQMLLYTENEEEDTKEKQTIFSWIKSKLKLF